MAFLLARRAVGQWFTLHSSGDHRWWQRKPDCRDLRRDWTEQAGSLFFQTAPFLSTTSGDEGQE